jgi:hypothetical protein
VLFEERNQLIFFFLGNLRRITNCENSYIEKGVWVDIEKEKKSDGMRRKYFWSSHNKM